MESRRDFLRRVPLLADLDDNDLDHLNQEIAEVALADQEVLFNEGDPGDACYLIVDGGLSILKRSGDQSVLLAEHGPGVVVGEMALVDDTQRIATVAAIGSTHLLRIDKSTFNHLLETSPAAAVTILRAFSSRIRETEARMHHNEKLTALGTMTAGIAHELNNPAAAARRASEQLTSALDSLASASLALDAINLSPEQREILNEQRRNLKARIDNPVVLDTLTRSDREEEIELWLEDQGIDRAWERAPQMVDAGFEVEEMATFGQAFEGSDVALAFEWMAATFTCLRLAGDISGSMKHISTIVGALKQHTYLDQAPIKEVDIHEGIENTLIILGHKLKGNIEVIRDYDQSIPQITAYASELTQVWTNLIDNAADALDGKGTITIRTRLHDPDEISVEISDDGPGIPPEVESRIFEPFFTTKGPGVGTGLGLHISRDIIVRHNGHIHLDTKPGSTTFTIHMPVSQE